MEKQKKWQFFLILTVITLTIYNILPTLFYYLKPLNRPITESLSQEISSSIIKRTDQLETDAKEWVESFCNLLQVKPISIAPSGHNLVVTFTKADEAAQFRKHLPYAGATIPFAPARLELAPQEDNVKEVIVQRHIPCKLDPKMFAFAQKGAPLYRDVMIDRAAQLAYSLAGPSDAALAIGSGDSQYLETLASQISSIAEMSSTHKGVANRYAMSFTQGPFTNRPAIVQTLISAFDRLRDQIKGKAGFEKKELSIINAENFLKKHEALFSSGQDPLDLAEIKKFLNEHGGIKIGNRNPLFSDLKIDWENNRIILKTHHDIDGLDQPLINELAKMTRNANETLVKNGDDYFVDLHKLPNLAGYLVLDLETIEKTQAAEIQAVIKDNWHPKHADLQSLSVVDFTTFNTLQAEQKALCLVIHADKGVRVIAKGIDQILKNYEQFPHSEPALAFSADFRSLTTLLQQNGFRPYQTPNGEIVFERIDYFQSLLGATREEFEVKGTRKFALLELSNLEQRIAAENRIDTKIHEDLIKWKDEYNTAQVSLEPGRRYTVPKPTKSVWANNLMLTARKLIRGDERKVLHWGLDLSGGKTVQIELRDANNQVVKNEEDIKQGINELYTRVNKMGVSEVVIRQLGNNIVLDFPGSQSFSAQELIQASSMYFHVVNEQFSLAHPFLAGAVNRFLQEVWNEAVVTNRQSSQDVNTIAWKHLHGESISEAARTLLENGLQIQSPQTMTLSHSIDDSISKIAVMRGSDSTQWQGQSHPLLIVFRQPVLEGSQLEHIHASYDPQKGNSLNFGIQSGVARNNIHAWTSRYAEEKVAGSSLGEFSKGRGWRMAVILNDTVISAPTLNGVLRDSATISGNFSQREINQLAADLKAGSLTFTPHILSEKNVSPELGKQDRVQGIAATAVAFILVVVSMVGYYRFAGLVASVAVLFNLLILWATLQNMGASLSLAGIAGIILTVGMAVDANVLVFERFKEEFAISGKISSAIAAGYKKAYSAIVDSNVTTIIAALVLLNFDAGPIKGFAITLIIGIVSSMFTALFMTRYYFIGWVQNPKAKVLTMANWIHAKSIDFLKHTKLAFAIAIGIIVVGGYFVYAQRATILGMDFTGGYSLHLEVEPRQDTNYITAVEQAFLESGAATRDFQIRELNPANHLRILFGTSMAQKGKPFFGDDSQENFQIQWVIKALNAKGISLTKHCMDHLESNWTAMSGQMSNSMRNNALIGLLIAFVCIFIYITFRFEYQFAAASIICLLHDVLITIGLMGILHALGVPVQIDLNTVAAIMTIVGYSLNDTIIIFDRIREEMRLTRYKSLPQIINHSLNTTLSRTTITSGTTLLVLIALVALGGSSIFSFALVMTIGVLFGTLSSWYIASPLMLYFHKREERNLKMAD